MSSPAQPSAETEARCVLCNAPLTSGATRCRACGMYQQLGARRPNPFTRGSLWALAALLAAVYVVALVIVSLAR
jgi:ribosomal protein L40E